MEEGVLRYVTAEAPPSQEVEAEEGGVQEDAEAARGPDGQVAEQVHLGLQCNQTTCFGILTRYQSGKNRFDFP